MKKTAVQQMSEYLATQGLRSTSQRDAILNAFIEAGQHLSVDDLYARVRKSHPGIGYATIYRTLKVLAEAGLAEEHRFENGFTRFEYKNPNAHHDHLICTGCGSIFEFENESIEALQQDVAGKKDSKCKAINWKSMDSARGPAAEEVNYPRVQGFRVQGSTEHVSQ